MNTCLFLLLLVVLICCSTLLSNVNAKTLEEIKAESENAGSATPEAPKNVIPDGFSAENEAAIQADGTKYQFQAEVNRLMDIIINSLYKNKEVFLRELISNSADAMDKVRFLALSNEEYLGNTKDLEIRLSFNKDLKTLTIRDTGIGMTREDLVNNLGTVAKSGTAAFAEAASGGADMSLIGQFGVGFYSVYLVADKVRVTSKNNDDDQYIWESTADSQFTVSKDPRGNTLGRGTEITMFLKEDAEEFLSQYKLDELVKKYSEFIPFPIYIYKKIENHKPDTGDDDEEEEDEDEVPEEESEDDLEVKEEDEEKSESKTENEEVWEWDHANNNVAIWSRDRDEVAADEYQAFFKAISDKKEVNTALTWNHFKAEGEVEFRGIVFLPSEALNLYDNYKSTKAKIRLYVRRVMIQEDFEDLLPAYMNFVRGVVDSDDLPLNVSRENLQQHRILSVMARKMVRKVLETLRKLANGEDENVTYPDESDETAVHPYIKFYEQFGRSLKMGIVEDSNNRSKLAKLLRFKSSKSDGKYVSFEQYVANFKEWQKEIYYIAGESIEYCDKSPFVEAAKSKGVEVLYLTEAIDEYSIQHLADFEGHKIKSLTKEGLKFGDEDEDVIKKRTKAYKKQFKGLTKYLKTALQGKVSKVVVSQRVEKSPAVIVTSQYGHTANMERIMRAQTLTSSNDVQQLRASKTLEINPRHPIVIELSRLVKQAPLEQMTQDLTNILFDTALQTSGFTQDDPDTFAERIYRTMAITLGAESLELAPEIEIEEEEEESTDDKKEDHEEL